MVPFKKIACSLLALAPFANADPASYNIVFIGDSITHGVGTANPATQAAAVICAQLLEKQLPGASIHVCNQGYSGHTALGISRLMPGVEKQIDAFIVEYPGGRLVFSIMLGTNDSANHGPLGSPTSAADYRKNLKAIVDEILAKYPDSVIFLQRPIFYSPNTHNSSDYEGAPAADRLKSYFPQISGLAADYAKSNPRHVFEGDTKAYDYFAAHYQSELAPEQGANGTFYLHPNATGAAALGKYWAEAIAPKLK